MRSSRRPVAALLVLVIAVALGGCGGGGSDGGSAGPSQQDVIERGDAVCRRTTAQITALSSPEALTRGTSPTKADLPALAEYFVKVATLQRRGVTELRRIDVPVRDRATVRTILDGVQSSVDALEAAVTAARAGDLAGFQARYNDAVQTTSRAASAASRYGFKVCGQQ
jgi:hypothetical protein